MNRLEKETGGPEIRWIYMYIIFFLFLGGGGGAVYSFCIKTGGKMKKKRKKKRFGLMFPFCIQNKSKVTTS